jgi:hypothetical protein
MRTFIKYATAATLAGALAVAMATPSQARYWRHGGGAALGGFVAGAVVGAAAANAYGPGYYYDDGYAYAPGPYAYGYDSYAYAPGPGYYGPAPRYYGSPYRSSNGNCGASPASTNFTSCN